MTNCDGILIEVVVFRDFLKVNKSTKSAKILDLEYI